MGQGNGHEDQKPDGHAGAYNGDQRHAEGDELEAHQAARFTLVISQRQGI